MGGYGWLDLRIMFGDPKLLEKDLFTLIIKTISDGLIANGMPNVKVKQSFQPMQDGTNTGPTVYLYRISDHRYGSPTKSETYNSMSNDFDRVDSEVYESLFQATVLFLQNPQIPGSLDQPTALDIANLVSGILQTDTTIQTLLASNVQILRIQDIRKPSFVDDKARFEFSPNFDFTLTHEQDIIGKVPVISKITDGIYPIS